MKQEQTKTEAHPTTTGTGNGVSKQLPASKSEISISVAPSNLQQAAQNSAGEKSLQTKIADLHANRKAMHRLIGLTLVLASINSVLFFISPQVATWMLFALLIFPTGTGCLLWRRQKQQIETLAKHTDKKLFGVFCDLLEDQDAEIKVIVRTKLTQMLPLLKEGDAILLNLKQQDSLRHALLQFSVRETTLQFQIAVLNSYERIGCKKDLWVVEEIADSQHKYYDPRLIAAAQHCLESLRMSNKNERGQENLLRASSIADQPVEQLLRPAKNPGDPNPGELLRTALRKLD